jgi:hypothetical protein
MSKPRNDPSFAEGLTRAAKVAQFVVSALLITTLLEHMTSLGVPAEKRARVVHWRARMLLGSTDALQTPRLHALASC